MEDVNEEEEERKGETKKGKRERDRRITKDGVLKGEPVISSESTP